tara:strand:- start:363 stop:830 length:468 start_codon:yes stop_codon:yes gene_type:complete
MFGKLPGGQNTAEIAMAQAQQVSANTADINPKGFINPMTDPLGAVASLQQKYIQPDGVRQGINPRFLAGAKPLARAPERFTQGSSSGQAKSYVAPASTGTNPFMDSSAGASTPSYTASAAAQDPINNAINAEQQGPVSDVAGNMFMRQQSMQGLV